MAYRYERSDLVDPDVVARSGCFTTLPVRISKFSNLINDWSLKVYKVFEEKIGTVGVSHGKGMFDETANAIALSCPEILKDRIKLLAYQFELALLHDDIVDTLNPVMAQLVNNNWADGCVSYAVTQEMAEKTRAKKQIESRNMLELMEIDRNQGQIVFNHWKDFYEFRHASKAPTSFKTFEEWREFRYMDAGTRPSIEYFCFGVGIKLSQAEKDSVMDIVYPASEVMSLANDYYSFEKEYASYVQQESTHGLANGIWVLMRLHGITAEEAKEKLRSIILSVECEYHQKRRELEMSDRGVPEHIWRYIDTVVFMSSGSFYWSTFCSRYNAETSILADLGANWMIQPLQPPKTDLKGGSTSQLPPSLDDSEGVTSGLSDVSGDNFLKISPLPIWQEVILAPYEYICSMPSKRIRNKAIEAFNVWFEVPEVKLVRIKSIITLLHNASLMLDDIEDNSYLRRGKPVAHKVFGDAQTINSANYLFVIALEEAKSISPAAIAICISELKNLHQGQSMDLYWTHTVNCPSEEQYVAMIDQKTGGLFRLLGRLMESESTLRDCLPVDLRIESFTTLVGRYFQIRDDYQNLCSNNYASQKGFCEDFDEGKFSLPLIHAFKNTKNKLLMQALLFERKQRGNMSFESKKLMLDLFDELGSLEYAKSVAQSLEAKVNFDIGRLEDLTGKKNWILRLIVDTLKL